MVRSRLQLFIAGNSPSSRRALANLQAWRGIHVQVPIELCVIDVLQAPEQALAEGVLLTPQLVVHGPAGRVVIVGDLADAGRLSDALQAGDERA